MKFLITDTDGAHWQKKGRAFEVICERARYEQVSLSAVNLLLVCTG